MKLAAALLFMAFVRLANAQTVLSNTEALQAIYPGYDSATETADGKSWHGNDASVQRISVAVILSVQVNTGAEGPRAYVVTSAVPQPTATEKYDCHGCRPEIGVGIFLYSKGSWRTESSDPFVSSIGAWGGPPDADLVRIGPNLYGVMLSETDGGQGYMTTTSYLLAANGRSVSVIWNCVDHDDNEGAYDPTDSYADHVRQYVSAAYRFVAYSATSDHYDIQLISRGYDRKEGSEELHSEDWTETYRFKDHEYQLLKRTSYRELPKATKATR